MLFAFGLALGPLRGEVGACSLGLFGLCDGVDGCCSGRACACSVITGIEDGVDVSDGNDDEVGIGIDASE